MSRCGTECMRPQSVPKILQCSLSKRTTVEFVDGAVVNADGARMGALPCMKIVPVVESSLDITTPHQLARGAFERTGLVLARNGMNPRGNQRIGT